MRLGTNTSPRQGEWWIFDIDKKKKWGIGGTFAMLTMQCYSKGILTGAVEKRLSIRAHQMKELSIRQSDEWITASKKGTREGTIQWNHH